MKFFKNVKEELKKVKWPDRKYMVKYSLATVFVVVFTALYFYGVSALISAFISWSKGW